MGAGRACSMGCRMAGCDCTIARSAWNCGLVRRKSSDPGGPPPPAAPAGCAPHTPLSFTDTKAERGTESPTLAQIKHLAENLCTGSREPWQLPPAAPAGCALYTLNR